MILMEIKTFENEAENDQQHRKIEKGKSNLLEKVFFSLFKSFFFQNTCVIPNF